MQHYPAKIKQRQEQFVHAAKNCAARSVMTHKHGCVIVHKNEIIASACNEITRDMKEAFSLHAEINALQQIKHRSQKYISECELYIVRIRISPSDENVSLRLSKPCKKCAESIQKMGLRKVYYSID